MPCKPPQVTGVFVRAHESGSTAPDSLEARFHEHDQLYPSATPNPLQRTLLPLNPLRWALTSGVIAQVRHVVHAAMRGGERPSLEARMLRRKGRVSARRWSKASGLCMVGLRLLGQRAEEQIRAKSQDKADGKDENLSKHVSMSDTA